MVWRRFLRRFLVLNNSTPDSALQVWTQWKASKKEEHPWSTQLLHCILRRGLDVASIRHQSREGERARYHREVS